MARERRRKGGDDGGGDRWLATYGDLVTLLMAFFVMLYAMSEVDIQKFAAFVEGLAIPFGNNSAEGMMPESSGLLPENNGLDETQRASEDIDVDPEAAREYAERVKQLEDISEKLQKALEKEGLDIYVEQRRENRGLVVSIATDDVLFGLGSTEIGDRGRQILGAVAEILGDFSNKVMIEGYTDDIPLRRASYDNWNLSTDRAVAVLKVMVQEHGVPPEKVGAVGYGEHRPLVPNSNSENRARNRRVDIVVLLEEETTE
ncbi:MAG TPA: flagellar motor protein MotB [Egicoccus sp.]|nr:flagellar motor protein MotB [Egicoccus sp.]HSK21938.1 flagellar motor protein MotB [Egicoccus sp.]